ncbi:ferritin-like domain-containing protein [Gayadomonas joobiniege]|uniref:ferritin-like domain-containing protein n=1 Tax=Gayadomonas joobiniege TaxID=1234606 RepID=UPI00037D2689|nr:ferritin-like domain-containing protein [Gayadomonas joobiniege]
MSSVNSTLSELCKYDFDAVAAYEAAIDRVDDKDAKIQLKVLCDENKNHTVALNRFLNQRGEEAVTGPDSKKLLTKGKVVLADIMGDEKIIDAMLSNEKEMLNKYSDALELDGLTVQEREILTKHYNDEKRHKAWLEELSGSLKH